MIQEAALPYVTADLTPALTTAFARLRDPRLANPAWLRHLDADALTPQEPPIGELELFERALIAPVAAEIGVHTRGHSEELRIALDPVGALYLTRRDRGPYEWMDGAAQETPDLLAALLPAGTPLAASPHMTPRTDVNALRFTDEQRHEIAERAANGTPAAEAIAVQQDLDPRLRDALLSDRERAWFEITMHVPAAEAGAEPFLFHLLRRWNVGELGLYSADGENGFADTIHAVEPGDLLGTVLPILGEGEKLAHGEAAA